MSFEAKRLRVQLPCQEAGSLVEAAQVTGGVCRFGTQVAPTACVGQSQVYCAEWSGPCVWDTGPCFAGTRPPCVNYRSGWCPGFASPPWCEFGTDTCGPASPRVVMNPTELIEIEHDAENPGTVLLHPDQLPQFRAQLELEMKQIDALAERKEQIAGQIEEVDAAQQELEKRGGEE